jgi:predicted glycosyltransferase
MNDCPTVIFQPPNHIGLGHINRLAAIAIALQEMQEPIRSVFVVEGSGHVLLDALNFPSLPLPSEHALFETGYWNCWSAGERSNVSRKLSRAILRAVRPQLVVFDCFPNPAFARAVFEKGIPTVLCLREMRDVKKYLSCMDRLLTQITHLLIPHDPGAFELPAAIRIKSRFVGEIVRPLGRKHEKPLKTPGQQVVISGGGGGYPGTVSFYNLAIKALTELQRLEPLLAGRLITGPLFQDWSTLQLEAGVSVTPFEADMLGAFSTADLVISAAGYNISAELEQVAAQAILVPAERQWDDQCARAARLARKYSRFRVFTGSSPHDLARLAQEALQDKKTISTVPSINGARKAAEIISSVFGNR